ncbi:hypothetical protein [Bradyrhizobium arachidis]|uniref:terminase small subunit-like protein n=1 Tax=Bradyrhizobium arachidis TaxID=858423 RepID=UPI002161516F|nr:hypothetical protein [Bradyrhizobium arachidis]UVO30736.1 hypothetical protein KUF59_08820 [Bradyrhizobium arachidis]
MIKFKGPREGFFAQYARARELGYHSMADELVEIADDSSGDVKLDGGGNARMDAEFVGRSRLRVDTRKWRRLDPSRRSWLTRPRAEDKRKMTMRTPLILAATILGFSASAFAQTAAAPKATAVPKAASKPHKQPAVPTGCKFVGTVKGTKIWAGDCATPSELRGSTPDAEPTAPAAPAEEPAKQ